MKWILSDFEVNLEITATTQRKVNISTQQSTKISQYKYSNNQQNKNKQAYIPINALC